MEKQPHRRRARPGSNILRIFVAAYPTIAVADTLVAAVEGIELPSHRPVHRDQIHLTLQFVGDVDPRDLGAVVESVEQAAAGVPRCIVVPDRLITLPEKGPSRLVAAMAPEVPALAQLHERLAKRLARRPRGTQRFLPHLTLLRFRTPSSEYRLDMQIEPTPFEVASIAVVRSVLKPGGAEHREVADVPLG